MYYIMSDQTNTKISIIELSFINNTYKGSYESISRINEKEFIYIPTHLDQLTFVYNFVSAQRENININNVIGINYQDIKITDATDVEQDGIFWLLGILQSENKYKTYLIKGSYNKVDKKITLIGKYEIPEKDTSLKFEGLTKVNHNEFVLCSENGYFHDFKNTKYGMIYVKIDGNIMVRPLLIEVNGLSNFTYFYNFYKFSTIFNIEKGFVLMPQFPDTYYETCYVFSLQEIERIKNESGPISIIKTYHSFNTSYSDQNNLIYNDGIMKNNGIEALTSSGKIINVHGDKFYGSSTWIYPYFITEGEIAPPDQLYVEKIDKIPKDYDKLKVGEYIRPVIGIIKTIP